MALALMETLRSWSNAYIYSSVKKSDNLARSSAAIIPSVSNDTPFWLIAMYLLWALAGVGSSAVPSVSSLWNNSLFDRMKLCHQNGVVR